MRVTTTLLLTLLWLCQAVQAQPLNLLASTIELHLEAGKDVNHIIKGEGTLLQVASKQKNEKLIKLLLASGADPNLISKADDQPPLTLAIRLDNLEILDLLIEKGADINSEDSLGHTPLFKTLRPDRPTTRKYLLDRGANIDKALNDGVSAVVKATSIRNFSAIAQLVDNNASINAKMISRVACDYCHVAEGRDICENPGTPSLAGQHADYIAKQLADYHSNTRESYTKSAISKALVDRFNLELGQYYENLPRQRNLPTGSTQLLEKGKALYNNNCASCHGADGIETQNSLTPTLAGLNSLYVNSQLKAYQSGERDNDPDSVMRKVAAELDRDQIFQVSEYIQNLY